MPNKASYTYDLSYNHNIHKHTIYYKNDIQYKELLLSISKHDVKFNKRFSDTMKISIQSFKKPRNFLKSITEYMKKYEKKLKYFIT